MFRFCPATAQNINPLTRFARSVLVGTVHYYSPSTSAYADALPALLLPGLAPSVVAAVEADVGPGEVGEEGSRVLQIQNLYLKQKKWVTRPTPTRYNIYVQFSD